MCVRLRNRSRTGEGPSGGQIDTVPCMSRRPWSTAEDDVLRRLYRDLAPEGRLGEVAAQMNRTPSSVRHRASRLGISDPAHPRPRGENSKLWRGGRGAAIRRLQAREEAERRARGARRRHAWTQQEDEYLSSVCSTHPYSQIGQALGRTAKAVRARIKRLGLQGRGRLWQQRGDGHHNWRGGKAAADRRAKYRLEPDEFDRLLESQGGRCAICRALGGKRAFHVDHDHRSGRVRGILCHHCNLLLGNAKDDMETLKAAASYLARHAAAG
jgi:hypothetical protein